jgi:hypothetical protein
MKKFFPYFLIFIFKARSPAALDHRDLLAHPDNPDPMGSPDRREKQEVREKLDPREKPANQGHPESQEPMGNRDRKETKDKGKEKGRG